MTVWLVGTSWGGGNYEKKKYLIKEIIIISLVRLKVPAT